VLAELEAYSPLVGQGRYIVVFDTRIELTPENRFLDKPWGPKNSPMLAVNEFLKNNNRFKCNYNIEYKLQITECPSGYLQCISDK